MGERRRGFGGPKFPKSQVPRSKGPKDQDTTKSHPNTSLILKKVHLHTNMNMIHENSLKFCGPQPYLNTTTTTTLSPFEIGVLFVYKNEMQHHSN